MGDLCRQHRIGDDPSTDHEASVVSTPHIGTGVGRQTGGDRAFVRPKTGTSRPVRGALCGLEVQAQGGLYRAPGARP